MLDPKEENDFIDTSCNLHFASNIYIFFLSIIFATSECYDFPLIIDSFINYSNQEFKAVQTLRNAPKELSKCDVKFERTIRCCLLYPFMHLIYIHANQEV